MSRRPIEILPQRRLALELVFQIDHARAHPRDAAASVERLRKLVAAHPRGMRSAHIRHNVGDLRWTWLVSQGLVEAGSDGVASNGRNNDD